MTHGGRRTTLLVATMGGHLSELFELHRRFDSIGERLWVTNDHEQSRRLLAGERVCFVPFIDTRDFRGVARAIPEARRVLKLRSFDRVVSTGSAIALAYLPVAAASGIAAHYIESSTRVAQPSLTGSLLARTPGVSTWWQHGDVPRGWGAIGSVYDRFRAQHVAAPPPLRIVVTLGTTEYSFRRLLMRLWNLLPVGTEVFWQLGDADHGELPIDGVGVVGSDTLANRIRRADVVVSHAGAGSLLMCLENGKIPLFVPRRAEFGEQVDDHQVELAEWAHARGLACRVDASTLTWADLVRAAQFRAVSTEAAGIELARRPRHRRPQPAPADLGAPRLEAPGR